MAFERVSINWPSSWVLVPAKKHVQDLPREVLRARKRVPRASERIQRVRDDVRCFSHHRVGPARVLVAVRPLLVVRYSIEVAADDAAVAIAQQTEVE